MLARGPDGKKRGPKLAGYFSGEPRWGGGILWFDVGMRASITLNTWNTSKSTQHIFSFTHTYYIHTPIICTPGNSYTKITSKLFIITFNLYMQFCHNSPTRCLDYLSTFSWTTTSLNWTSSKIISITLSEPKYLYSQNFSITYILDSPNLSQ